jgi:DNA adenine methylase
VLRDKVTLLVRELELLSENIDEETFYQIRANVPRGKVARAARFIYLNKTCFNGLWRVNSKGEFNVPFAKYKNPTLFVEENLRACSKRLKNSTITTTTFQKAVSKTRKGDLVYFDPPYIPLSESASFASYSKEGFNLKDQEELARCIRLLTDKGVRVLLSNSDTPLSRKIFGFLDLRLITVQRSVGAHASTRIKVDELIGTNY